MQEKILDWLGENPLLGYIAIFALVASIGTGVWIVRSHMEAATFSRITGEQVTTWDAMWVQLRVDRPVVSYGADDGN